MALQKAAKAKKTATKKTKKKLVEKSTEEGNLKRNYGDYSLVIVESPSKAKTIKKYLGRGYQVVASNGHIKDLPKSKLGVDIKNNFAIELVPITGKKDKIARIQELAKDAKIIYLAPDMDREGEAIAFHLCEEIKAPKKDFKRVVFNAVTKSAVQKAIENPTELDSNKYDSQKTRRILDRLVGYKISPILWDKVKRGISAGRVQSVALRIIVEREDQVKAFIPEQWFSIEGKLEKAGIAFGIKYFGDDLKKKVDLTDLKTTQKIVSDIKGKDYKVVEVLKKERKQNPSPPFTTSKLQQEAANKLGFTAKRTMMVAQKLYEGVDLIKHGTQGLITYMRTDSVRTAPEAMTSLRDYIKQKYGAKFLSHEEIVYKKKKGNSKVQDAHEAIRPTNLQFTPEEVQGDLSSDEFKLYCLIWNKYISSQMAQAIVDQTTVNLENNGHIFRANGSIIKFPGFRTVYMDWAEKKANDKNDKLELENPEEAAQVEEGILPELSEGEKIKAASAPEAIEHWTSPPPRYNEASLVKELEEQGIGRPSTYASIISNILDRGYVEKEENRFYPTELGVVVCRMLVQSFPKVMDVAFTAKVEELLDQIEEGDVKWKSVLKDFWKDFEITLETAKEEMKNLKKQLLPTGVHCVKCKEGEYFIKWGKNGQFLACSNYPECNSTQDYKKHMDGRIEILPKEYHESPCPACGKKLEVKKGKYGRFLRCEEYPTCETTVPYSINVTCPECKTGKFVEKRSRFGKFFYGCSAYPNCSNALWAKPVASSCVSCGSSVMVERETKKEGKHLQCPKCKHKELLEEVGAEAHV
jgi:DNA topoisomerase I